MRANALLSKSLKTVLFVFLDFVHSARLLKDVGGREIHVRQMDERPEPSRVASGECEQILAAKKQADFVQAATTVDGTQTRRFTAIPAHKGTAYH